jgi:hypothetical protein
MKASNCSFAAEVVKAGLVIVVLADAPSCETVTSEAIWANVKPAAVTKRQNRMVTDRIEAV